MGSRRMRESDIKYDAKEDMWYIRSPLGVCMYFKYKDEAVRIMDEFASPGEYKLFNTKKE